MKKVSYKFKRLRVEVEAPLTKTGNGAIAGGKVNNFLVIDLGDGKENNKQYLVKGIRGWINHTMMTLAKREGIEVCHSSDKVETQKGVQLVPEGLHANGSCYPENECIKHKLMGSLKKRSKLLFDPVIICSKANKGSTHPLVQKVHIATDHRNALTHKEKVAIQDFGERYFSGTFYFTIEFLEELTPEELGFLLQAVLLSENIRLGASSAVGGGKILLKNMALQEVAQSRYFDKTGKVIHEESVRNLRKEMEEGLNLWP